MDLDLLGVILILINWWEMSLKLVGNPALVFHTFTLLRIIFRSNGVHISSNLKTNVAR